MERNPYRYGAPVEADSFCDRTDELATLTERMRSGIHAFVLSPRRYGKTSLAFKALEQFRAKGGRGGYANLLLCTTEDEIASVILTAVAREVVRPTTRARHGIEDVLRQLRVSPRVSMSADGSISLALDPVAGAMPWLDVLVDAINLLEHVAGRTGAALVLDEFQQIAEIGPKGLGGVFKGLADQTRRSSLVFCGSHLAVMENLTNNAGSPLYGMGDTFRIGPIPAAAMVPHLMSRAQAAGKTLEDMIAMQVYDTAGGIPNDVQWLAHVAFESAGSERKITAEHVQIGMTGIVGHQATGFAERYERLAPVQQRLVRQLAIGPITERYAKATLDKLRVANANSVTKAVKVLTEMELVQQDGATLRLTSPFFGAWILAQLAGT